MAKMNWNTDLLEKMIDEGYVNVNKHPTADLYIYNYTPKAQFDWVWNEVTMKCRGLILDASGEIVARPFEKFFSADQLETVPHINIPNEPFEAYEKMDGSLGVMYWTYDTNNDLLPLIATRGSFISDQACVANDMLYDRYNHERKLDNGCPVYTLAEELAYYCNPSWTYLYEVIYPSNRIVVDYGYDHKLVLLAIIDTGTGEEISLKNAPPCVEVVKRYDGVKDWQSITDQFDGDGREGFVIRFESGFRLKIKYEEYKRLHRIICNTSERTVWEHLKEGDSLTSLIKNVPDEFYNWLVNTIEKLQFRFRIIEDFCKLQMDEIKVRLEERGDTSRKAWALEIQKVGEQYGKQHCGIMFAMLTGWQLNRVRLSIWKLLRPSAHKPFQEEI